MFPAVVIENIFQLLIHYEMCYYSSPGTELAPYFLQLRSNQTEGKWAKEKTQEQGSFTVGSLTLVLPGKRSARDREIQ